GAGDGEDVVHAAFAGVHVIGLARGGAVRAEGAAVVTADGEAHLADVAQRGRRPSRLGEEWGDCDARRVRPRLRVQHYDCRPVAAVAAAEAHLADLHPTGSSPAR